MARVTNTKPLGSTLVEIPDDPNIVLSDRNFTDNHIHALTVKIKAWFWSNLGQLYDVDAFFGLAYTSSNEYPGLWVCNIEYEISEGQFIQGFTISNDGHAIMLTHTYATPETSHMWDMGRVIE